METLRFRLNFLQAAALFLLVAIIMCEPLIARIALGVVFVAVAKGVQRQIKRNARITLLKATARRAEFDCAREATKNAA